MSSIVRVQIFDNLAFGNVIVHSGAHRSRPCDLSNLFVRHFAIVSKVESQLLFCGKRKYRLLKQYPSLTAQVNMFIGICIECILFRNRFRVSPLQNPEGLVRRYLVNPSPQGLDFCKLPGRTIYSYESLLSRILGIVMAYDEPPDVPIYRLLILSKQHAESGLGIFLLLQGEREFFISG